VVVCNVVSTADVSRHDEHVADAGRNGYGDAAVLPSNTASHMHQLLNLQHNPQVMSVIFLSVNFIFRSNCNCACFS